MKLTELLIKYEALIDVSIHLIIDSGHGWNTGGKRSTDGSLRENQYNATVEAKLSLLCSIAKEQGVDITYSMLSPEHNDTPIRERVRRERKIFKNKKNVALVVGISIHADAFSKPSANGTSVYINPKSKSRLLAEIVQRNLINATGLKDRGVKEKSFAMLRQTSAPWILIEAAFMTNPKELKLLKSDAFRNTNALVIFESVLEFVSIYQHDF